MINFHDKLFLKMITTSYYTFVNHNISIVHQIAMYNIKMYLKALVLSP